MGLETPEVDSTQAVTEALKPFGERLDPAAAAFLGTKWGSELNGKSSAAITVEVTSRLNSGHFAGFFREGQAPSPVAPVVPVDRAINVKAVLETLPLQPGAGEQLLALMPDLVGLAPNLIAEVLSHRLSQPQYNHYLVPPAPRYMPGSVEEAHQKFMSLNRPNNGGLGGISPVAQQRGEVPDYSSGMATRPAPGAGLPLHPAMPNWEQMEARVAAGDSQVDGYGMPAGLGGKLPRNRRGG